MSELVSFLHSQSQYTFKELPFLVFGALSLLAAGISLVLPETRGIRLPDAVEEVEGIKPRDHELKDVPESKISKDGLLQTQSV